MKSRELRVCGHRGHVLYAPTEPDLRDRLQAETALGTAWRCLRCGTFVLEEPEHSGPASEAPVPNRGKALRQEIILRALALERILRAVVLFAAAYGLHRFSSAQRSLRQTFDRLLPAARPLAERLGIDIDRSSFVADTTKALSAKHSTLTWLAIGIALYAALEAVEGVGLWLARRWAEYLTVVATAAFLPLEVHEMLKRFTVTRAATFVVNVGAVVYLIVAKRLFGARGGGSAYERELAGQSLLEVEAAATERDPNAGRPAGSDIGMGRRHSR